MYAYIEVVQVYTVCIYTTLNLTSYWMAWAYLWHKLLYQN